MQNGNKKRDLPETYFNQVSTQTSLSNMNNNIKSNCTSAKVERSLFILVNKKSLKKSILQNFTLYKKSIKKLIMRKNLVKKIRFWCTTSEPLVGVIIDAPYQVENEFFLAFFDIMKTTLQNDQKKRRKFSFLILIT